MTWTPFRETTLADVVAASGPLRKMPRHSKRYVVYEQRGWAIAARPAGAQTVRGPYSAFAVLDSADCYIEVGVFGEKPYTVERVSRRRAEALCDELNAGEKA